MARAGGQVWCVDAVLRLLGVFHDVLYGDVAPVRPVSTLGVVSVRLSRSLFVPGRHLKKGGSPSFPPALGSHTRVATKRRVGFRSPASHTWVATARAERDAPTPMCDFFFFFGGEAVRGVLGLGVGIFGGGVLGPGLGRGGGSRSVGIFWGEG